MHIMVNGTVNLEKGKNKMETFIDDNPNYTYNGIKGSWFPIRIKYTNEEKIKVIKDPQDIQSGKSFVVTGTRVEEE